MAKVCQNLAVAEGHPASVSNNLIDLIGHMNTDRALALLHGAPTATREEADVQQRLLAAHAALQKAG
jgi:hypothetical protein